MLPQVDSSLYGAVLRYGGLSPLPKCFPSSYSDWQALLTLHCVGAASLRTRATVLECSSWCDAPLGSVAPVAPSPPSDLRAVALCGMVPGKLFAPGALSALPFVTPFLHHSQRSRVSTGHREKPGCVCMCACGTARIHVSPLTPARTMTALARSSAPWVAARCRICSCCFACAFFSSSGVRSTSATVWSLPRARLTTWDPIRGCAVAEPRARQHTQGRTRHCPPPLP